jgi:hypothetical protein
VGCELTERKTDDDEPTLDELLQPGPVVEVRASRWSLEDVERARQISTMARRLAERPPTAEQERAAALREAGERQVVAAISEVELGPEPPPCPYGSGVHRERHEILARREWFLRAQYLPLTVDTIRVAALLVSGGAGDYAAYMAIAEHDDFVADHGVKLGFTDAALLFPGITRERYRP